MKKSLVKIASIAVALAVISFAVIIVNQSAQLVLLAGAMHPLAGRAVFWSLLAFYAACILVPLVMWLRMPRSLVPPSTDTGPEFECYVANLRARLYANPRIDAARLDSVDEIRRALQQLDGEADEIIKRAGSRVFLSTALAQNGALDALFVLGLQSRLVWDVARVYRQRPSLRELRWLYANVVTTAFVAGELEELDLAEQIQPVVQNALGGAAGVVPGLQIASSVVAGSIVSGTANAFLTLRVGVVAKRYCGALTRPERSSLRRSAFGEAAGMLGAITASGTRRVVSAIARASGRTVAKTASGIGSKVVDGAGSVGSVVKDGAGAVIDTLTFRRRDKS